MSYGNPGNVTEIIFAYLWEKPPHMSNKIETSEPKGFDNIYEKAWDRGQDVAVAVPYQFHVSGAGCLGFS